MVYDARTDFKLSRLERQSDLWHRLDEFLRTRLEQLRIELEKTSPTETTEKVRGRIAFCREIQALGTVPDRPLAAQEPPSEF
jgi:hypothetical protein